MKIGGGKLKLWRPLPFGRHRPLPQFGIAIVAPWVALLICLAMQPLLAPSFEAPFIAAVALVAWLCGTAPALVSLICSSGILAYFFLSTHQFALSDANAAARFAFFVMTSGLIVTLVHNLFQIQGELEESEE